MAETGTVYFVLSFSFFVGGGEGYFFSSHRLRSLCSLFAISFSI